MSWDPTRTPCRPRWVLPSCARLFMASDIVVHQIDGPLQYSEDGWKPWRQVVREALNQ